MQSSLGDLQFTIFFISAREHLVACENLSYWRVSPNFLTGLCFRVPRQHWRVKSVSKVYSQMRLSDFATISLGKCVGIKVSEFWDHNNGKTQRSQSAQLQDVHSKNDLRYFSSLSLLCPHRIGSMVSVATATKMSQGVSARVACKMALKSTDGAAVHLISL